MSNSDKLWEMLARGNTKQSKYQNYGYDQNICQPQQTEPDRVKNRQEEIVYNKQK